LRVISGTYGGIQTPLRSGVPSARRGTDGLCAVRRSERAAVTAATVSATIDAFRLRVIGSPSRTESIPDQRVMAMKRPEREER
jgi:hypothetical protein